MAKVGAKGKYTPELASQIVKLIEDGNFAKVAHKAVGISNDTFYAWIKNKAEFSENIKKAKAKRISTLIDSIKQDKSWQSKAWMLERLRRKQYHLPTRSELEWEKRLDSLEQAQKKRNEVKDE
ncbi:MAG: hypothetical protein GY858_05505 [Candidatus Omnitrophica bacterium]|nr:hypothetical protein [Candidatus Omnitrophota bacterium]